MTVKRFVIPGVIHRLLGEICPRDVEVVVL